MRVHFYALRWNDARRLGFFFRHYNPFVTRYTIFDGGSDDGNLEILRAYPSRLASPQNPLKNRWISYLT